MVTTIEKFGQYSLCVGEYGTYFHNDKDDVDLTNLDTLRLLSEVNKATKHWLFEAIIELKDMLCYTSGYPLDEKINHIINLIKVAAKDQMLGEK